MRMDNGSQSWWSDTWLGSSVEMIACLVVDMGRVRGLVLDHVLDIACSCGLN